MHYSYEYKSLKKEESRDQKNSKAKKNHFSTPTVILRMMTSLAKLFVSFPKKSLV